MTKKDYQAIARVIYSVRKRAAVRQDSGALDALIADVADGLADVLAADNPRFNRDRFDEACKTGRCKGMPK